MTGTRPEYSDSEFRELTKCELYEMRIVLKCSEDRREICKLYRAVGPQALLYHLRLRV